MSDITSLFKASTEDEAFDSMLGILRTIGMPVDAWRKGGAFRNIIRACARVYAAFTVILAAFIASGFLESARGPWLTALARNVYGLERRMATRAKERITLTNPGGGLYDNNAIGSITVTNPVTKKAYQNAEVFSLGPGATISVVFIAVEAGSASTAGAGTITNIETTLGQTRVTNPNPFVGADEESDDELRQACIDSLGARSVRGPRSAYAFAVRQATRVDGTPVNVNRKSISPYSSTGKVYVYLASPSGAPVADDITAVATSIENIARPDGITVYTLAATPVPLSRTLDVWVRSSPGSVAPDIASKLATAYAVAGSTYPIGGIAKKPATQGYVYADFLAGVAKQAWPDVFDVDGTGADQPLNAGEVPIFDIAINVRLQEVT